MLKPHRTDKADGRRVAGLRIREGERKGVAAFHQPGNGNSLLQSLELRCSLTRSELQQGAESLGPRGNR